MNKTIFSNRLKNKFVIDTIWTLFGSLIVGCSGLVLQTLVNHFYSIESLGVYSQVIAFYTLFSAIACMGVETSVLKYISENSEDITVKGQILTAAIILISISSFTLIALLYYLSFFEISFFSSVEVEKSFQYIIFAIPLFAINKLFIATFNALRQMKKKFYCENMQVAIS